MIDLYEDEIEEARRRRRRKHREEMRRQRQKQLLIRRMLLIGICVLVIAIVGIIIFAAVRHKGKKQETQSISVNTMSQNQTEKAIVINEAVKEDTISEDAEPKKDTTAYTAAANDATTDLPGEVVSTYGILVDCDKAAVLARRNSETRISPASMTKILTVLVAAEHVTNLDDTMTITREMTDFSYSNDCSSVGFADGETVTVRDLFYGTILPSGGDAAIALATYVAGSQEAFVELMNEKLAELGLSDSAHFTNCVGLYDDNHYCTAYDMAMILEAAVNNDICREALSAHTYTTTATSAHPEGITISNWFLRRIEDKETGGDVVCAKTGYVIQSGNCAASFETTSDGRKLICVTANSTSGWRCIYDHVAVYQKITGVTAESGKQETDTETESDASDEDE